MHKFLTFLLTIGGSLLIMSSVTFAQDNTLPLGAEGYDKIFTENRAAQVLETVDYANTGDAIHRLFVKYNYNIPNDPTSGVKSTEPSALIVMANIIIGAVALLYLTITGIQFIVARGEEEALNNVKKHLGYVLVGLLTVAAAETFAFVVFNPETANFLTGEEVSDKFVTFVNQVKLFIQWVIVGVATMSLLFSGYELITRMGSEESFTKEKEFLRHFLLAAALIAFAEVAVKGIFFARDMSQFNKDQAIEIGIIEIMGLVNFMLGLIAAAATFMLILASFYYMMSFGDEDRAGRAKRIIISCIIGIVLALSAYTLVSYFTQFQPPTV